MSRRADHIIQIIDDVLIALPKIDWTRAQDEVTDLLLDVRTMIRDTDTLDQMEADLRQIKRRFL